ncbi:MAG: hypothetical protein KA154_03685 [Gemmatimonadaceae bacterium]|jgi:hypothetical protein|nr:hypothetical protein [Gemmatimonadaceae bacterium]MCC6245500.1 hypothetical protein [Gemmatimonadaceae bacterium]
MAAVTVQQTTIGNATRSARTLLVTAVLLPSLFAPAMLAAQTDGCSAAVTPTRLATQALVAAAVTGIEYQDMARQGSWHMAQESDKAAVFAHPSSHLHGLGSYHMARNLSAACGNDSQRRQRALRGAAISLALGAAKEVSDGWYNGFSPVDLGVDALGAGYAVAQAYVPVLRHLTPTYSVAPQAFTGDNGVRGAMTNYTHQTLWLSANVHNMLPTTAAKVWPAAMRLSIGRRAAGNGSPTDYVVGLDLDAQQLPGSHPAWMKIKQVMHNVRLPGPALIVNSRGTRSVGLYW